MNKAGKRQPYSLFYSFLLRRRCMYANIAIQAMKPTLNPTSQMFSKSKSNIRSYIFITAVEQTTIAIRNRVYRTIFFRISIL